MEWEHSIPTAPEWAAKEIARLRAELASVKSLLTDKTYIQCKADYYRGHLSHANYLNERERAAFNPTVGDMEE